MHTNLKNDFFFISFTINLKFLVFFWFCFVHFSGMSQVIWCVASSHPSFLCTALSNQRPENPQIKLKIEWKGKSKNGKFRKQRYELMSQFMKWSLHLILIFLTLYWVIISFLILAVLVLHNTYYFWYTRLRKH